MRPQRLRNLAKALLEIADEAEHGDHGGRRKPREYRID